MSENRYLLSFTALLAGALVVCTPMVLFRTAAEHDTSWLDAEPQIAPYAVAGKGWEAVVTAEPVARDEIADLPPAVPLARVDTYVAYLPEVRPVLAVLSAEDTTNADEPSPELVKVAELDEASPAPAPQHMAEEPMSEPVQVAELDEASPAPAPQHEAQEPAPEVVQVSEPDAPMSGDDSASSATPAAEPSPDIAPPLPSRRPAPIRTAEIVVAQEKAAPRQSGRVARSNDEVPPQRWRPMALAPADTPAPAPPKLSAPAPKSAQPTMTSAAHRSKVWSALAHAKPRTGERGSTTVTFNIGANGALRGARIARSSGNAKIDQAALATVRQAGPFPAPPGLKSGAASYSIRIDFR